MREEFLNTDDELLSEVHPEQRQDLGAPDSEGGAVPGFEQLFAEHRALVYGLALKFLGNPEDAEDVTQEVFTKVWRNLDSFNRNSSLKTWVYRIAINCCIDYGRKPWRRHSELGGVLVEDSEDDSGPAFVSGHVDAEGKLLAEEEAAQVRRAITHLKPHLKAVLVLKELEELSYDEISVRLGLSMGTISSRLNRARHALQEAFCSVVPRLKTMRLAEQA